MIFKRGPRWDIEADVVIVGTGAAGMTAALRAHDAGAKVLLLESTALVGGTTAVSGGGVWVPLNSRMQERGFSDTREDALAYCLALTAGRADDSLVAKFVDSAAPMIDYVESATPLRFRAMTAHDYHPEVPGGRAGGRSVEAQPFDMHTLGDWRKRVRPAAALSFPITLQEAFDDFQAFYRPWSIPQDVVAERMSTGVATLGQGLVGGLLRGVLDRGITILLEHPAESLAMDRGAVQGIRARHAGREVLIRAVRAVILASGGFEWNEDLRVKFMGGPALRPNSPPCARGDGLVMAMEVGADLANMNELWHYPSLMVPGESYDGQPMVRGIKAERSGPHIIWVNAQGRRFVNEAANYNSVGRAFFTLRTDGPSPQNLPAWAVFDQQFRERYVVGTTMPEDPDPGYLLRADTLEELAQKAGIDARGLADEVARWNGFVAAGRDADFGKGESSFDRYQGDWQAPHRNLGTVEKHPFYALPLLPGALGTKGGPRTDTNARVVNVRGLPIPGLYAAGNVAASICGPSYYGVGSTLGPAMTWGWVAGHHAATAGAHR